MQYFAELSENQKEALGKQCRKCGTGVYVERSGRYGLWVQCNNWACKSKVYRPRGRSFPQGSVPQASVQQAVQPASQDTNAVVAGVVAQLVDVIQAKTTVRVMEKTDATLAQVEANASAVLSVITDGLAELKANTPKVIEVRRQSGKAVKVTNAHYLMPRLLQLLGAGFNLYLWGPAGSGKTTAALQAAEALGMGGEIDTLDPTTFRSMVQGYMTPAGEPVHTAFTRCWTQGRTYVPDETDNAPGHVQTLFNSALANGHAPLAWGNVARKDGFGFVGTGNTPGRPTREFPDRKPMSAAFADRLYFMYWPLDPAIECRAGGIDIPATPEPDKRTCSAADWTRFVRKLREWGAVNMPTLMITPRATLAGIQALALGEAPLDVAHGLIFRGADSEIVTKALAAVKLP